MNKFFTLVISIAFAMAFLTLCSNSKTSDVGHSTETSQKTKMDNNSLVRNRDCFHHRHFNTGGVCLLSSYAFLLEYANSSDQRIAPFDNFNVMELYMDFHREDEDCPNFDAEYIRNNQISAEKELSKTINNYCMQRGWSGYIRINQFHDWLKSNTDLADNVEFVKRMPQTLNNNGKPLTDAYDDIASYLERNSSPDSEYDYAALICYATDSGPHSVLLGFDSDYFIRDVNNNDRYVDINSSFDFTYSKEAPVLEYDIFKVKRQAYRKKRWKDFDQTHFQASTKTADGFLVLDQPIPLKHIRVTSKAFGADGQREYTEIKIRSFNDKDYELTYGNYYGSPLICINGQYSPLGHLAKDSTVYEFDLGQISDDLYIWGYQPNFNFEHFSYQ